MSLEQYKKPDSVVFDVEGSKFVIDLPSRWNRRYVRAWQEKMAEQMNDQGKFEGKAGIAASKLMDYQHTAFAHHCFLESLITPEQLVDEYYPLLEALFEASSLLVKEKEDAADALVGKLSPTSSGKLNGAAKPTSTKSLPAKEELPAMT